MKAKHYLHTLGRAGLLAGVALLVGCMPYSTGPTEVGVRTVKWSPFGAKGVQEKFYNPGTTSFFVPFLTDWKTFDTRLQKLEMTAALGRGDRQGPDALRFKTIDGNDIVLDITIQYRIVPEFAPMILQEVAGNDEDLKENIVRTITRSKPRDIFGELITEDFYVAERRIKKADEVKTILNEILKRYGVVVERVNLGDYEFNPDYTQAIEQKKVADQQTEKTKSETNAKLEEFNTEVERAKAAVEKVTAQADGEYLQEVIKADAYYQQQMRIAEAILAEGRAAAEGIRKMNEALAGAGGEAMVKLAIAEALTGKRIIMLPMGGGGIDVRSTNINDLLTVFGIQQIAQPAPSRSTVQSPKPKAPGQ